MKTLRTFPCALRVSASSRRRSVVMSVAMLTAYPSCRRWNP